MRLKIPLPAPNINQFASHMSLLDESYSVSRKPIARLEQAMS